MKTIVLLETVDYHGYPRSVGGDPISAELTLIDSQAKRKPLPLETEIVDLENGTYEISFRPQVEGRYSLKISVFERSIKDYPLFFDVTEHNEPVKMYGRRGSGKEEFNQAVAVAVDDDGTIYVVDTGNSRIKVKVFKKY